MGTLPNTPAAVTGGFYEAVLGRDADGIRRHLHDHAVLHVPGTHRLAGDHEGPDAIVRFLDDMRALTDGGEHVEVIDVLEGAEHVAVYCHVTASRRGRAPLDNTTVHLLRVHDGRVVEAWLHNWDGEAVNDFWS